ncbi:MAG: ATP-binding protein [Planctomycetota bacterium]|nr:ATP-binding protein [Planctomycetota bacterium]
MAEHTDQERKGRDKLRRTVVLHADATVGRDFAADIGSYAEGLGYASDVGFVVRTILGEALANAILHGNYELTSEGLLADPGLVERRRNDPDFNQRQVILDYEVDEEKIRLRIEDEGRGFDPEGIANPTDEERHMLSFGRGLYMIRQMADDVRHLGRGNILEIVKYKDSDLESN